MSGAAILAIVVVVVVAAAIAAGAFVAKAEATSTKQLYDSAGDATKSAFSKLDGAMKPELDEAEVAARMSGLAEFVHAIPHITASERRGGFAALVLALAALTVAAGALVFVVDRVEDRRELAACADSAARGGPSTSSPGGTGSATSVTSGTTTPAVPSTVASGGTPTSGGSTPVPEAPTAPPETAVPGSSTTSVAPTAPPSTTSTTPPGGDVLPTFDAIAFMEKCKASDGDDDDDDDADD